jgi:oligopeptide/dipeptide ABC transporter ATP-binding protein
MTGTPLLEVRDLSVSFRTQDGTVHAVDGVSFAVNRSEVLGIVGESGSGKSVTAMTLMRLVLDQNAVFSGEVLFNGRDLMQLSQGDMLQVRGKQISMIFQDPMTSLNPVYRVGWQIDEQLRAHEGLSAKQARRRTLELLGAVGIPNPEARIDDYPHQFSGGMRQRVMIAMGLSCNPDVLIADEPTTALDVTIQAQILRLLDGLRQRRGTAVLLITHDLGVVAQVCDRVAVMYAGQLVEVAATEQVFAHPAHPYTEALLRAVPGTGKPGSELAVIPGQVPDLAAPPAGCRFAPRCPFGTDACATRPALIGDDATGAVACWHPRTPGARRTEVTAS